MCHWTRTLRTRLAAMLIAVLVLVPVVDAFACSFEDLAPTSHAMSAEAGHDDARHATADDADAAHETCGHHHCHHTASTTPPGSLNDTLVLRGDRLPAQADDHLPSRLSDGPMRPPRA